MSNTLNKLLYILPKGDSFKLGVLLFLMLIAAFLEVLGIGMIPAFVAIIANPDRILTNEWLHPFLYQFDLTTARDLLIFGSVTLLAVFIIKSAYIITYNYFEARLYITADIPSVHV